MALSGNMPLFGDPTPTFAVAELNSDDVVINPNAIEQHFEGSHRLQNLVDQRYLEFSLGSHNAEHINGIVQEMIASIRMRGGRFVVRGIVLQMPSEADQSSGYFYLLAKDEQVLNFVRHCFLAKLSWPLSHSGQNGLEASSLLALPSHETNVAAASSAALNLSSFRDRTLQHAVEASYSMQQTVFSLHRELVLAQRHQAVVQSVLHLLQLPLGEQQFSDDPVVDTMRHVPEIYQELLPQLNHPQDSGPRFSDDDLVLLLQAQALAEAANDTAQLEQIQDVLSSILQNRHLHHLSLDAISCMSTDLLTIHVHLSQVSTQDVSNQETTATIPSAGHDHPLPMIASSWSDQSQFELPIPTNLTNTEQPDETSSSPSVQSSEAATRVSSGRPTNIDSVNLGDRS